VEFLRQLAQGLRDAWTRLSASARVNLVVAGLGVVLLVALVAWYGVRPQYVTLAANLQPSQVAPITDLLEAQGVPYRIENNNSIITVPASRRSSMLLALAENDIKLGPGTTPGLELFQETDLMTNKWLRDVNYMRAVQGEIEKQLNALDFVDYSMVLIRESREELFVSDQRPSEAAVTLKVNRPLTKKNIKGIVNMVAAAGGANLNAHNITITTTDGDVLYMPPDSEFNAIANSKLEHVAAIEQRAESRIMQALDDLGVMGTVKVSAQVNFDQEEIQDERYSEGAELSTMETSTVVTTTERLPEGAPGALANVPEGTASAGGTENSEETTETITNSEPSRTMTRTTRSPGEVIKYTVALVVESDREVTTDPEGNPVETPVPLSEARRAFYTDLVRGAVGQGQQETEVLVNDHPFEITRQAQVAAQEAISTNAWMSMVSQWAPVVGQVVLLLLAFLVLRIFVLRAIETPSAEPVVEEVEDIPTMSPEDMRRQEVVRSINELAGQSPEVVAMLLRSWINEEES
jgi:flagellar M-ring protein FliF